MRTNTPAQRNSIFIAFTERQFVDLYIFDNGFVGLMQGLALYEEEWIMRFVGTCCRRSREIKRRKRRCGCRQSNAR
uniref:Uncharacterized protein n=1 Tax=Trichuris muris TaxID=70415 RepID=A0A5S6QAF4_TRIMR